MALRVGLFAFVFNERAQEKGQLQQLRVPFGYLPLLGGLDRMLQSLSATRLRSRILEKKIKLLQNAIKLFGRNKKKLLLRFFYPA
jgi:hypothetical protein